MEIHKINSSTNLAKVYKACLRYEGRKYMDNLNCKIHVHARVCKENKLEQKQHLSK